MSEMIERVARWLCISKHLNPDEMSTLGYAPGEGVWAPLWMGYENPARSIIGLMREPTEAMLAEGQDMAGVAWDHGGVEDDASLTVWQAMIDAALT